MDFETRLKDIARADVKAQEAQEQIRKLKAQIANLEGIVKLPEQLREQLRIDVLEYVNETGDVSIHPDITFKRTSKWIYDKSEALTWAEQHAPQLTRVTTSLDVRKFEAALNDGIHYDGAEKVHVPQIAIPTKLGHLIIEEF